MNFLNKKWFWFCAVPMLAGISVHSSDPELSPYLFWLAGIAAFLFFIGVIDDFDT